MPRHPLESAQFPRGSFDRPLLPPADAYSIESVDLAAAAYGPADSPAATFETNTRYISVGRGEGGVVREFDRALHTCEQIALPSHTPSASAADAHGASAHYTNEGKSLLVKSAHPS